MKERTKAFLYRWSLWVLGVSVFAIGWGLSMAGVYIFCLGIQAFMGW